MLKIGHKKEHKIWPILGGTTPDDPVRDVTPDERKIAIEKGLVCPISISLERENEFKDYLEGK